jgi:LPS export ABC transporter protein LptC
MPRFLMIALAAGLGLGLIYLIFVRDAPRMQEQAGGAAQQAVDMTGVVFRQQRGGDIEWIVTSDRAVLSDNQKSAELRPVRFQVLRGGGTDHQPLSILGTAESAYLDQVGNRVVLVGSSRIVKDGTLELKSDELAYTHTSGVIKATGHVQITQSHSLIEADSAEYVIGTDKLTMLGARLYQ